MKKYDYLVVGAGLFGATFARLATRAGMNCLVVDKRSVVGGNCYDEDVQGVNVHKYGPHIFHTSKKYIWDFVNGYSEFNHFINSPLAISENKLYNLPFNMNTFYQLWGCTTPVEVEDRLAKERVNYYHVPNNLEEQVLNMVGPDIYHKLVKGYTEKHWGVPCSELSPNIIKRLPIRLTFDNNYFNDIYQGIPSKGYHSFICNILDGIDVSLNIDFNEDQENLSNLANKIVYTGSLDELHGYCFGELSYRSIDFATHHLYSKNVQGNAVINYIDSTVKFTRVTEHRHFDKNCKSDVSILTTEFPIEYDSRDDRNAPRMYPIRKRDDIIKYKQYKCLERKNMLLGGRLAEYKYYDMDKTIESAFELANKEFNK